MGHLKMSVWKRITALVPDVPCPRMPDFLGIGAQKAGTTWLFHQLRSHPGLYLPPRKELHYFDIPKHKLSWGRVHDLLIELRGSWTQPMLDRPGLVAFLLYYYLAPRGDLWYAGLFAGAENRVRGEITPAYATLRRSTLRAIRALAPDLRFIFLLRDPIDRAWSQARMELSARELASDGACLNAFANRASQLRSRYTQTLDVYGSVFGRDRIFVGFYDAICQEPTRLLHDIFAFLGVDAEYPLDPTVLSERFFCGRTEPLRPRLAVWLARSYHSELRLLEERLGERPGAWLRRAERILQSGGNDGHAGK